MNDLIRTPLALGLLALTIAFASGTVKSAAGAGETLKGIDSATGHFTDAGYQAEAERSAAEDLDVVSALSTLQTQQTAYNTALQAYASVQKLSLFDYIRT